jgi:hypothetical protein
MTTSNNPLRGQIGDAAVEMRDKVETRGIVPCAVHKNTLEIVTHQLSELQPTVYVWQQLQLTLSLPMLLAISSTLAVRVLCL